MKEHGKSEVLGTVDVDLRTLLEGRGKALRALLEEESDDVHALELMLSRNGRNEGQLHLKVSWEKGSADFDPDAAASAEARSRVSAKMNVPKCLISAQEKIDTYGIAVDKHERTINHIGNRSSQACTHIPHAGQCTATASYTQSVTLSSLCLRWRRGSPRLKRC